MAVVQVRLREHRRSKNEAIRRNASAFIGENGGPECNCATVRAKEDDLIGANQAFWQNEAKIFNDISIEFIDENGGRLQVRPILHFLPTNFS